MPHYYFWGKNNFFSGGRSTHFTLHDSYTNILLTAFRNRVLTPTCNHAFATKANFGYINDIIIFLVPAGSKDPRG